MRIFTTDATIEDKALWIGYFILVVVVTGTLGYLNRL